MSRKRRHYLRYNGDSKKKNIYKLSNREGIYFLWSLLKQIIILRRKKIDIIIDFELFRRISAITSFLIKPKLIAGFFRYKNEGLYRGSYLDIKCSFNQNMHIAKNFLALTKTAFGESSNYQNYKGIIKKSEINIPKYKKNPKYEKIVKDAIRLDYPYYRDNKIILVCPDVGKDISVRNYPKEKYVKIISRLLNIYQDRIVILIGERENEKIIDFIFKEVDNSRCINFCSKTSNFIELMELISMSELFIGNDNGPAHFASLTNSKILSLFSTDSPFIYGSLGKCVILYNFYHCSPCINVFNQKDTSCNNNLCLKCIGSEQVVNYAIKIIDGQLIYNTINNKVDYL